MSSQSIPELTFETALSPLDGRYWARIGQLAHYFSEAAWMKYRVRVELEYFVALRFDVKPSLPQLRDAPEDSVRNLLKEEFDMEADCKEIKKLEAITNHDIKAVEYFVKSRLEKHGLQQWKEFVHFGLTSQDINNTSIPMAIKDALLDVYLPALHSSASSSTPSGLIDVLRSKAQEYINVPMLARTHGQPATPTRVGKEIMVFVERLERQLHLLKISSLPITAKFSGATGQFNAHVVAYPSVDWLSFADTFIESRLGLKRQQFTTQIEHYDGLACLFDAMARMNTILLDLSRDFWQYISMDYFKQKVISTEVGSSAMPHKVNPIDFENAEGNFGVANALLEHMARKLPISRLQRDLTDSTVLRNVGVAFGHSLLGIHSLKRGLSKLLIHPETLQKDLEMNWAVVSEAIQTILRREGYPSPYEALKALTRDENSKEGITQETIHTFIDSLLGISNEVRVELKSITPFNYIGVVPDIKTTYC
jgi:adenylosuccinate lyase